MAELDLMGLRTFVAICEKNSMTDAARHLGMTQSAVSQRLRRLENQSRFQLIDRSLRPIAVTSAGQVLLQRARLILSDLRTLEFSLSGENTAPVPELRFGVSDSLGTTLVPSLVRHLKKNVTRLALRVDGSADLCRLLLQRELHAVISSNPLLEREDLERYEVHREPLLLVSPPSFADDNASKDDVETMLRALDNLDKALPFIRYTSGTLLATQIDTMLSKLSIHPSLNMEFNGDEAILEMVREGLGWTITTPSCLIQSRVVLDQVRIRRIPLQDTSRGFYFLSRRAELGSIAKSLAEFSSTILHRNISRHAGLAALQLL